MPTLLQLNVTANWGSTGKIAENIGKVAQKRGWNSHIAFGRSFNPSKSNLFNMGNRWETYYHYGLYKFFDSEGFGSKKATKKLFPFIDKLQPDIIHLHNLHDHWINFPLLFEYLRGIEIPIIWTFHDCWGFTGGCGYFIEQNCYNWAIGCGNCIKRKNQLDRSRYNLSLKKKLIENLDDRLTIVSVSHWLDDLISQSTLNVPNHKVIYNGVDTEIFKIKNHLNVDEKYYFKDKFVILGVSNIWASHKGLNDFHKLRNLLDDHFIIVLVGLNKSQIKDLPNGIIGLERTSNQRELIDLYNRANVVMSLSKAETFGMTLIEGQACGTPSIGYATTAINEVISDKTGIKVEPGNVNEVAMAVNNIKLNNPFSPSDIRNQVISKFDAQSQFDKYVNLYQDLIK